MSSIKTGIMIMIFLKICTSCGSRSEKEIVSDVDGNTYHTVEIGTQVWMTEDLKTTHFNDGEPILQVEEYDEWSKLYTPAFCWYNNDSSNRSDYGALYNWYAVNTGKLCPKGWHVPSDEEWNELSSYLTRREMRGGSLKEAGDNYWRKPNEGATNETGFTALPAGYRSYNGSFNLQRAGAFWWTSSLSNWWQPSDRVTEIVFHRNLRYNSQKLFRHVSEVSNGFCVRCIMNEDVSLEE